jgi:hypothetical protein
LSPNEIVSLSRQKLRLWEFFVADVSAQLQRYKQEAPTLSVEQFQKAGPAICAYDKSGNRFSALLDVAAVAKRLGRSAANNSAPVTEEE